MNTPTRLTFIGIVAIYVLMTCLYAWLTPPWESPDEPAHYLYVTYLAQHGQPPPPSPIEQIGPFYANGYVTSLYEWYHPALGYALPAIAWRLIDQITPQLLPHDFPEINPRFGTDPFTAHTLFVQHRTSPFDLDQTEIGLLLLRLISALLGIPLIWAVFQAARQIAPEHPGFALTTAAVVAWHPQFDFISSTLRNDTANNLLSAISILALLRLIGQRSARSTLLALGIGGLLGMALLTKATAAFLLPAATIAFWLSPYSRKEQIKLGALALFAFSVTVGIYLLVPEGRTQFAYGLTHAEINTQLLTLGYLFSIIKPTIDIFWARFGWANIRVPELWIIIASIATTLGMILTAKKYIDGWRAHIAQETHYRQLAFLFCTLLFNIAVVVRYNLFVFQPQGRFFFPSLVPLSILALWGCWQMIRPNRRILLAGFAAGGMLLFNVLALVGYLIPAYYTPH